MSGVFEANKKKNEILDLAIGEPRVITLANALAITDTTAQQYQLSTHLTAAQIRAYSRFKIQMRSTHDQAANVVVAGSFMPSSATTYTGDADLYNEVAALRIGSGGSSGKLILQSSPNTAEGASEDIKSVPGLADIFSDLIVRVTFPVAPTTGALTITVEMH